MVGVRFSGEDKYLRANDLISFSKQNGFYKDILGVADKIPKKTDMTVKLGLVKFFILNCPNVKKHIRTENPENLHYLMAYTEYITERASKHGDWFVAQENLAKKLPDCAIHCSYLPQ